MAKKEEKDKFEEAAKRAILKDTEDKEKSLGNVKDIKSEKVEPESKTEGEYKSLGKAKMHKYKKEDGITDELKALEEKMGYIDIVTENLPSKGKFYPYGTVISIRSASVQEVRDFSTVEETNLFDVDDKLNNILAFCVKVQLGDRKGTYKDILEEDRIFVILSVRELTFSKGENKLMIPVICDQCQHENSYELRTNSLQYYDEEIDLGKYYDDEEKVFNIRTKTAGNFAMRPPSIGVMKEVTSYIKKKEEKREKWDKAFLQVLPYMVQEWRGFNEKSIFDNKVEFQGWSTAKYTVVYRLAEKMKIGVKTEFVQSCEKCQSNIEMPVSFPGGIKSLFVGSNIEEELI